MSVKCTDCRRPLGDQAYYCNECLRRLEQVIGDMPALLAELEVTATRQARISERTGPRSKKVERYWEGSRHDLNRRVPYNWNAADLLWSARNTLATWARIANDDSDRPLPKSNPADESGLCVYLIERLKWFRTRQEVTELMDEMTWLRSAVIRSIDRAAPLLFAGSCDECTDDQGNKVNLYARPGAESIVCSGCGTEYDIAARREAMLADAEGMLFTATQISQAVASWGQEVTPERIRKWKERGRISTHGFTADGSPLYLLSDILDKLYADQVRKAEKVGAA